MLQEIGDALEGLWNTASLLGNLYNALARVGGFHAGPKSYPRNVMDLKPIRRGRDAVIMNLPSLPIPPVVNRSTHRNTAPGAGFRAHHDPRISADVRRGG